MDFLLETIGFPPDWCGSTLLSRFGAAADPGRPAPLRLAGGLEVHPDRPLDAVGSGSEPMDVAPDLFWPGYSGGRPQRLRAERVEPLSASPHSRLVTGRVLHEGDPFGRESGTPIQALVVSEQEAMPDWTRTAGSPLVDVRLAAFAVEVRSVLPAAQQQRMTPARAPQGRSGRLRPLEDPDAPAGCCELDLSISAVHVLHNPLTGCAVDLIEATPPWSSGDSQAAASPLALFVSPWQLAEDRLERLAPGDRVRGTFLLAAREG